MKKKRNPILIRRKGRKKILGKSIPTGIQAYIIRYWDANGKVRHVSTGAKVKSQAQEVLNSFKGLTKGDPETIILKHLKVNQYAPKTIEKYQYVFKVIKALGKPLINYTIDTAIS